VQRIEQLGERLPRSVRPFSVLPEFAHLIAGNVVTRPFSGGLGLFPPQGVRQYSVRR
jgi:hypothetical protein